MIKTHEGGTQYEHSLDHHLEFFSKAGSMFANKQSFYQTEESALSLFQKCWIVDRPLAFKLLLWLRDCRGGAGNRSAAREIYKWLALYDQTLLSLNIEWIPVVGRYDDLRALFNTGLESKAAFLWSKAILEKKNILAAKWADRKDKPLQKVLAISEAELRKLLAAIRKLHIVEHKMCTNTWNEIVYKTVPSVAMARYTKAFTRHDEERFLKYKEALKSGKETVHAAVLFPHDCVRTVKFGDREIADAQFDALPNYMEGTDEKIIVISDTSGSMDVKVSGSVQAIDISQGLALYCSAKIDKDNPFHKKFIGFCSEGKFKNWEGMTFSQAVRDRKIFDRAVGSTQIDRALDLILETAKFFKLNQGQMPTMLLIVSDMQFHDGAGNFRDGFIYHFSGPSRTINPSIDAETEVNKAMARWVEAGYNKPKIIYWNTSGYAGSPETVKAENTALVSGFSPAILKSILGGDDLSPAGVMLRTLEKYEIRM